jgi:hypothetical protein
MMYEGLCSKLPRGMVNVLYGIWYASLMVLILDLAEYPMADFYYLHG